MASTSITRDGHRKLATWLQRFTVGALAGVSPSMDGARSCRPVVIDESMQFKGPQGDANLLR
jgi:hypothetical protein